MENAKVKVYRNTENCEGCFSKKNFTPFHLKVNTSDGCENLECKMLICVMKGISPQYIKDVFTLRFKISFPGPALV